MADEDEVPSNKSLSSPVSGSQQPIRAAGIVPLPLGSRGPRSLYLKRHGDSFGFTLRHFIVYPPDGTNDENKHVAAAAISGGTISSPLDTIFVKHVKDRGPAKTAGLQRGDRLVAVNGSPVIDKSYAQVVQLIQNSPDYLHLLVIPKEEDILQRYFLETAHNPISNQNPNPYQLDQLQCNQSPDVYLHVDSLSWRSLRNPYLSQSERRDQYLNGSGVNFCNHPERIYAEIGSNESVPNTFHHYNTYHHPIHYYQHYHPHHRPLIRTYSHLPSSASFYGRMGRRGSEGCEPYYSTLTNEMIVNNNNNISKSKMIEKPTTTTTEVTLHPYPNRVGCRLSLDGDRNRNHQPESSTCSSLSIGSKDSLSSFESSSTLTGHETDDSAIMTRYRKSFQQKEEFLRMPPPPNSSSSSIDSTNAHIVQHREFYSQPKKFDRSLWPPKIEQNTSLLLVAKKPPNQIVQKIIEIEPYYQNIDRLKAQMKQTDCGKESNAEPKNDTEIESGNDNNNKMEYPNGEQIVHRRARDFESGKPMPEDDPVLSNRTSFYRSELARLSSKRVVPNVTERAQEFEVLHELQKENSLDGTKKIQRDGSSLDDKGSNGSFNKEESIIFSITNNKKKPSSGNVLISSGSKYLHCPPPSENGKPISEIAEYEMIPFSRSRSNSTDSWIGSLPSEENSMNKAFSAEVTASLSNVQSSQLEDRVNAILSAPKLTPVNNNNNNSKANRPTHLDLRVPIRPARHLKPQIITTETDDLSPLATFHHHHVSIPTVTTGDDNINSKSVTVKRRTKSTNLGVDERGMRRESYLKATEIGRVHFDGESSDGGDASPQTLRSGHKRWRPPLFPGDIQQLRKLFEDTTSSLGGSASGNSSSSNISLEKTLVSSSSSSLRDNKENCEQKANVIKEGQLSCKITEIDGKRASDRSWKQIWAMVRGSKLFLYKDKHHQSPIGSADAVEHSLAGGIDMKSSIVRIAEDYTKRKHVLRVASVSPCRSQFLLQAESTDDLSDWVKVLQQQLTNNKTTVNDVINPNHQLLVPSEKSSQSQISSSSSSSSSVRTRSPTGQSPLSKTRKPSVISTSTVHTQDQSSSSGATSPKSKTWRGRVAKQFRKMHNATTSPSSPTAPNAPVPLPLEGSTFCIPLEQCMPSNGNPYVPRFVEICTDIVDTKGLETVGIYRVPGNNASITALTEEINRTYDAVPITDTKWNDLHVVSSLLKSFFRKMPDSLVTNLLYPAFIKADKIENSELRMMELKRLIGKLPPYNYHTLKHIVLHLERVVMHSNVNKMEAKNLAIVFGPTIVRPEEDNMESMVNNMTHQCKIVETLLTCAEWFFTDDANILPPNLLKDFGTVNTPNALNTDDCSHIVPEPSVHNQALLLDNISKYEALKDKEKNGALFSSIISAAQRKVRRKSANKTFNYPVQDNKIDIMVPNNDNSRLYEAINDLKSSTTTNPTKCANISPKGISTILSSAEPPAPVNINPSNSNNNSSNSTNNNKNSEKTAKRMPWFNYTTDQEEFHRRVENFELETKAMLQMPRNVEISVSNLNKPLSSSLGSDNNHLLRLSTSKPTIDLLKTHSASNVSTIRSPHITSSNPINNRNSLDATYSLHPHQYSNMNKKYDFNSLRRTPHNGNTISTNSKMGDLSPSSVDKHNKTAQEKSTFPMDYYENKNGRYMLRRGSSVENLNSSTINLNAIGTMKKVKYENNDALNLIQQKGGSLDSLSKLPSTADDDADLLTSLTQLYDKKLKEKKAAQQFETVNGDAKTDGSTVAAPNTTTSTTPTTNLTVGIDAEKQQIEETADDKENIPLSSTTSNWYRNPSLHKHQFLSKLKWKEAKQQQREKDEDSTATEHCCHLSAQCVNDRNHNTGNSNKKGPTVRLKRSESLNKPERTNLLNNFSTKLKRSESLNKAPAGGGDQQYRLKRSDSLTKSEKTECNLNRKREITLLAIRKSKEAAKWRRKNGLADRSIKRRHTVGGTKDPDKVTWLLDNNRYNNNNNNTNNINNNNTTVDCPDDDDVYYGGKNSKGNGKETNLRTSSPDLSSTRRETLCLEINLIGPENMLVALKRHFVGGTRQQNYSDSSAQTALFSVPLESQV